MKKEWLIILLAAGIFFYLLGGRFMSTIIERMAEAIKNFEGWFPGSRSFRNNNPGNLKDAGQPGVIGRDDQGHAIFGSYQAGWDALVSQLRVAFEGHSKVYSPTMSLRDFFRRYAEANQENYAQSVARELGVTPEITLNELRYV